MARLCLLATLALSCLVLIASPAVAQDAPAADEDADAGPVAAPAPAPDPGSAGVSDEPGSVVGVAPLFYFDDGRLERERQVAIDRQTDSFAYTAAGLWGGRLWYLAPLSAGFRWGGSVTYYGSYELEPEDEDPDDDEEPSVFELGQLVDLSLRVEWLVPVTDKARLTLGLQGGVPVLFVGGDLADQQQRIEDEGADVWDTPRIGWQAGPMVGFLWRLGDRLSVRGDMLFRFESIYLFDVDQDVHGIPFRQEWSTDSVRTEAAFGIEVDL